MPRRSTAPFLCLSLTCHRAFSLPLGCAGVEYAPVCAAHKAALEAGWRAARPKPAAYAIAGL